MTTWGFVERLIESSKYNARSLIAFACRGQSPRPSFLLLAARPILCCLAAVFLVLCSAPVYGSYSRNISFGTTKITYNELMQLIEKTHNFVERTNANFDERISNERVSIGDGKRTVKVRNQINLNLVKELPRVAYFASYSIDSSNANSPITCIQFDFSDSYRTLTIEGNNSEQVDALFSLLRDEMDTYSFFLGGHTFRGVGGFAILILFVFFPLLFVISASGISKKAVGIVVLSCLTILVVICVMPFDKWLPGFVVYDPNASFLARNSALFTFLSFIVFPVPFIGNGILWIIKKHKEEDQRTERIESKIGDAIQKVEEIKKSPNISYSNLSIVEDDIRNIAEEFFSNRDAKMLLKKRDEVELETREMRLNTEWRPVYLFLVNGLIKLLESYNEKLIDTENISYEIPVLPNNIFSKETAGYKGTIKFNTGVTMLMHFYLRLPYEKDLLPSVIFEIQADLDRRKSAQIVMEIEPIERVIKFHSSYDEMNIGMGRNEEKLENDNYMVIILDFLKKIIEHQLII